MTQFLVLAEALVTEEDRWTVVAMIAMMLLFTNVVSFWLGRTTKK